MGDNEMRPYALADGIREYLDSLAGLHRLVRERREAGRQFEFLPVFCVLGRYLLLRDGSFAELTGIAARADPARMVLRLEEFEEFGRRRHRAEWRLSYRVPARLAPENGICPECDNGWTIENSNDAVTFSETRTELVDSMTWRIFHFELTCHEDCHRRRIGRDECCWAEDFLDRAGLPSLEVEIVNGRIKDDPTPGFRVTTPAGPIRFGRRGDGFGLEWKETGIALPNLFDGEHRQGHPIEHGEFYVLPPDEIFLFRHFQCLREALGF
jgi:hypothetical protein